MKKEINKFLKDICENKKVLVFTLSGYNHVGQEAIVQQTIKEVLCFHPKKVILISLNPFLSRKLHSSKKIKFIKIKSLKFLFFLFFCDVVLIAGDELSSSRLDIYYNSLFKYFQGKIRLFSSFFSILMGKKVIFYKVGLYSFQKNYPKKLFYYTLRKSETVIARDEYSKKILQRGGLKKVFISKDPTYDLRILKPRLKKRKKIIDFALYNPLNDEREKQLCNFIIRVVKNPHLKVRFIIFSKHPYLIEENDLLYTLKIINKLKLSFIDIIDEPKPLRMKKIMSEASLLISMRFHPAVFADSMNVPFLVIPTTTKVKYSFTSDKIFDFSELRYLDLEKII